MAVFLANIGVNAAHAARSPLFPDGTFRVLPIPERAPWRPPMLRLEDLPGLAAYAPPRHQAQPVHFDPDLVSEVRTYGDNCRRAPRAFALRGAAAGDRIVFVARLHPADGPAAFHLVGELIVGEILADVRADPGPGWWDGNAHVRRARGTGEWDSFWVFRGAPGSGFYASARPFRRSEADVLFGAHWNWRESRTELQTIGSYTRTIRLMRDPG